MEVVAKLITIKLNILMKIYLSQDFDMAKGEFDMLYLLYVLLMCWEGVIFSFDKSTSLEGGRGAKKKP